MRGLLRGTRSRSWLFEENVNLVCVSFKGGYMYVLIHKDSTMNGIENGVV